MRIRPLSSGDTVETAEITDSAVTTAKINNDAVTYAKIQNVSATDKLLGRSTAGAGDVEEIACTAAGRALLDDANAAAQAATLSLTQGTNFNAVVQTLATGTAYQLTNSAAALDFGTTDPVVVLNKAGRWLIFAEVQLEYTGATVIAETASLKLRRTNNTAADVTTARTLDLPVATTLTHTYGSFKLPVANYTTAATDDSITIFGNVSAGLGAGTIDASAASITALYLGAT